MCVFHSGRPKVKGKRKRENRPAYPRNKLKDRARHIRRKFGISVEAYMAWFERAEYRCETCRKQPENSKDLHLDHCHVSGKIRGVLCRDCNHALGNARDNAQTLINLADYLKKRGA